MHLLAQLLSQLHLNPVTLICTVVQKFCFCCQTCDWWPCHCSVRGHHSPTRNITLTLLRWLAATKWQLSAYHHTLTHKMQPLNVAFMKSFKTYYAQQTKCGYSLIRDIKQHQGCIFCTTNVQHCWENLVPLSLHRYQGEQFWSTGIFPFWLVVFRDHDFALNHKDFESTLQFDKNRCTHLLCWLTSLLIQISEAPAHLAHSFLQMFCLLGIWISAPIVHWESVWENCWEEL